ncbi:SGNH/GDSL hydrolase family protein [Sutcliffiella horikoshii]|uniref:SGNH/GDSL hydrolase family protein n=1 Tax=Sutcliffiella horikoshii TaxID=79883 RepID=UPI003CF104A3
MLKKWILVVMLIVSSFLIYPPATAESPGEITYIAIGDSLTAGLGSSEENYLRIHGFVPQFTKYLREKNNVTVENYGIPGLSSTGLLALLNADEALQNRLKTAGVISVSIGGNDFLQTIRSVPESEDETALNVRMEILKRTYQETYKLLRELNPDATIILLGLYNPYPEGHELTDLGAKYAPLFNGFIEEYGDESNTLVIDPYEAFEGKALEWTHIAKDDIHPNDRGYTEITQLIRKAYEIRQE